MENLSFGNRAVSRHGSSLVLFVPLVVLRILPYQTRRSGAIVRNDPQVMEMPDLPILWRFGVSSYPRSDVVPVASYSPYNLRDRRRVDASSRAFCRLAEPARGERGVEKRVTSHHHHGTTPARDQQPPVALNEVGAL
jgi:hypothetical protein